VEVDRQVDQGRSVARFRTDPSASAPPIFTLIDHDRTSKTCRQKLARVGERTDSVILVISQIYTDGKL
jgi:hypothetical protein